MGSGVWRCSRGSDKEDCQGACVSNFEMRRALSGSHEVAAKGRVWQGSHSLRAIARKRAFSLELLFICVCMSIPAGYPSRRISLFVEHFSGSLVKFSCMPLELLGFTGLRINRSSPSQHRFVGT